MFPSLRKMIAPALALLLLCACARTGAGEAELLQEERQEQTIRTVQVSRGDVKKMAPGFVSAQAYYEKDMQLLCTGLEGLVLQEVYVNNGDRVTEGQKLASFARIPDDQKRAELERTLRTAQLGQEASLAQLQGAVSQAQAKLSALAAGSAAAAVAQLELEKAEYCLEHLDRAPVTRAQRALDAYDASVAGQDLLAPFSGTVEQLLRVNGEAVQADTVFCRIYTQDDSYLIAQGVNETAYRVGSTVQVKLAGEQTAQALVLSAPEVFGAINAPVIARLEPGTDLEAVFQNRVTPSMSACRMVLRNVLRLPKQAVRNENGKYYVYLDLDGQSCRRSVQVGLEGTDPETGSAFVQIIDGLAEGDLVRLG